MGGELNEDGTDRTCTTANEEGSRSPSLVACTVNVRVGECSSGAQVQSGGAPDLPLPSRVPEVATELTKMYDRSEGKRHDPKPSALPKPRNDDRPTTRRFVVKPRPPFFSDRVQ